jgi:hypothetical protein
MIAIAMSIPITGCGKKSEPAAILTTTPTTNPAISNNKTPTNNNVASNAHSKNSNSITESDAKAYASELESAIKEGRESTATKLLGIEHILEMAIETLDISKQRHEKYLAGARNRVGDLAHSLIDHARKGGSYSLLRIKTDERLCHAIFRLVTPDGGVNYHDVILHKDSDGRVAANDVRIFSAGETLSQICHRVFLRLSVEDSPAPSTKLTRNDKLYLENIDKLLALATETQRGNAPVALAAYRDLPKELKDEKCNQLLAVLAAQRCGDEDYRTEIEAVRKNHAGDPAVEVMSVTYYLSKGRNVEAIAAIDALIKEVGPDPIQIVNKGKIYTTVKNYDEGKKAFELAVRLDPQLDLSYWSRIFVALKEENHADTLTWLRKRVEAIDKPINLESLNKDPEYMAFRLSNEYKLFLSWYTSRKK